MVHFPRFSDIENYAFVSWQTVVSQVGLLRFAKDSSNISEL